MQSQRRLSSTPDDSYIHRSITELNHNPLIDRSLHSAAASAALQASAASSFDKPVETAMYMVSGAEALAALRAAGASGSGTLSSETRSRLRCGGINMGEVLFSASPFVWHFLAKIFLAIILISSILLKN
jgi:hypothetical protein